MKKSIKLLFAFVAIIGLGSCTHSDDVEFIAQPDTNGISFTNSFNDPYVLTAATSGNVAERFVWNTVDFGVSTNITYELQGSTDPNFTNFDVLGNTTENNLAVKVSQFMTLASDAGLDNDPTTDAPNTGQIYFRVRAYAGTDGGNGMDVTSEIKALTVKMPEAVAPGAEELPKIFVVGNFLAASGYGADWTPADAAPLAASATGKTDFEGFVNMDVDAPQYKFLPTNVDFTGDYGDAGDSDGSYTGVLKQEGEVNAGTPDGTGGYFYVKADTEALSYSLTKTTWGVIGNATPTGWDADTNMTYDPDTKTWSVTLDLTQQEATDNGLKFRANDAWDLNLGDTGADGSLEFGGDNIGVPEAGNYTITLDLSNPRHYTYTLTKN